MSYILEALKKAQSERQLGSAPTIPAVPIQAAPPTAASSARTPLWIGLAALALLAVGAGAMWSLRAPAPAAVAPVVLAQPAPVPAPAPAIVLPPPPAPAALPVAPARTVPVAAVKPAPAVREAPPPAAKAAPVAEAVPAAPAPEDALPFARDLPEPMRSELPKVAFGGYMYSKNPADRLLLIDKVLRHEGEEVAPGLVLEKLLPKAAVMNYRGTRYRVAY